LILKRCEKSGRRETARRLRGVIGKIFRLAVATLRAPTDPTYALQGALLAPVVHHRPAITDERQLGALMASIDQYDGWPTLKSALLFLALRAAGRKALGVCPIPIALHALHPHLEYKGKL
jgi:hypothetical protein